jgi:hypothetical protein
MERVWPQAKVPSIRKKAKDNKMVNATVLFFMTLMPPSFHCKLNSGYFGFFSQLNPTIQKLPEKPPIAPLEAFYGKFPNIPPHTDLLP